MNISAETKDILAFMAFVFDGIVGTAAMATPAAPLWKLAIVVPLALLGTYFAARHFRDLRQSVEKCQAASLASSDEL